LSKNLTAQVTGFIDDDDDADMDDDKPEQELTRKDEYVYFTNDRDLGHHETI
jgi:hypothetical protein